MFFFWKTFLLATEKETGKIIKNSVEWSEFKKMEITKLEKFHSTICFTLSHILYILLLLLNIFSALKKYGHQNKF